MKCAIRSLLTLSIVAVLSVPSCHRSASAPTGSRPFFAQEVGSGRCTAINSHGQIVGAEADDSTFVVSAGGIKTVLSPPDKNTVFSGVGIDDSGRVAGYATSATGRYAVTVQGSTWTPVPGLGSGGEVAAVSPDGMLGGASYNAGRVLQGFVLKGGVPVDLPWPATGNVVRAVAGGRAAGMMQVAGGSTHAFVSTGKALLDLGTLGGASSAALGMNSAGDVVGASETASGVKHAFYLHSGATAMVDLGLPGGAVSSAAHAIDAAGQIVGNSEHADGSGRAWLFQVGQEPLELKPPEGRPYFAVRATAISGGHVVGWGVPRGVEGGPPLECLVWSIGAK